MFLDQIRHFFPYRNERLHAIIHGNAIEAGAVGFSTAQIPGDRFVIGAVQINMIILIGSEFGEKIDKAAALAIATTVVASVIGVEVANGIIKYWPGVGNFSNAGVATSVTETIGWATVQHFEKRGIS